MISIFIRNVIKLFDILKLIKEDIDPEEATRDESAIQTVIDGKRNVGAFTVVYNTMGISEEGFLYIMKKNGLKTIKVPENPHILYVFYRPGSESEAKELASIAKKYEGYFAWYAKDEDTRRIGELLGYRKDKVEDFIQKNSERAAQKRKELGIPDDEE